MREAVVLEAADAARLEAADAARLEAADAGGRPPPEEVRLRRASAIPGVELWTVRSSPRAWAVFHTTYAFCAAERLGGQLAWRAGGESWRSSLSTTMVFTPGDLQVATEISGAADLHFLLVPPVVVERELAPTVRTPEGRARIFPQTALEDAGLVGLFDRLRRALERPQGDAIEQQHQLRAYLRAVFAAADHPADDEAPPRRCDQAVERARVVLEGRYAERITLDDLARETGFSKFYLERSFHERLGLPIHQYLKKVRVARALALLRHGQRPSAISTQVGFADQPHMTRVFREELGFTPRRYWVAASARPI